MNEQTNKLIEQLAQKLGTTSQYLWSILLKQAHISAIIDLIYFVLTFILGIIIYKLHNRFSKETGKYNCNAYEDSDPVIAIMVVLSLIWMIFVICCFCCIGDIINGFFNPEYWALNEILKSLKSCN